MKAILIDVKNKTITNIDNEGTLENWYESIGCKYVTVGHYFNEHDSIIVDDEGLLNPTEGFFFVNGAHQPFAGNGLVVGVDEEGNTVDVDMTAEDLKNIGVTFIEPHEIRRWISVNSHLMV